MQIRPAVPGDENGIAAVLVASWDLAYEGIVPAEVIEEIGGRRVAQWRGILTDPPAGRTALVSETAAGITGVVMAGARRDGDAAGSTGEIDLLYVHPDHWTEGHGTALLAAAADLLRADGFTDAVLWVHPGNTRARSFYERRGWHTDGATKEAELLGIALPHLRYRIGL